MKISKLILILLVICATQIAKAQQTAQDSITFISTAKADGTKFRLKAKYMRKFAQQIIGMQSDIFKPSTRTTSEFGLLKNSLYNKEFRKQAFKSATKQIRNPKLNNIIYIGGPAIVLAYIILLPSLF